MANSEYRANVPDDWFVDPVRLGVPGVRKPDAEVDHYGQVRCSGLIRESGEGVAEVLTRFPGNHHRRYFRLHPTTLRLDATEPQMTRSSPLTAEEPRRSPLADGVPLRIKRLACAVCDARAR